MSKSTTVLQQAEAAYRVASADAETLREARNQAVRQAIAEGMTHRQVGEATGLSRGRISQIIKRAALFAVVLALTLPASALAAKHVAQPRAQHELTLVNSDGTPAGGLLQALADQSRVSTGNYTLTIGDDTCSAVNTGGIADGCSDGPGHGGGGAFETMIAAGLPYGVTRFTFYFEMGHQFDWHFLTDADRSYLAWAFGRPHWRWWDTTAGLQAGTEDGLEAVFADVYMDCALGHNDKNSAIAMTGSPIPQINVRVNVCPYIDSIAAGS